MLPDTTATTLEAVRQTYDGPLTLATDLMVWNVTDEQIVVRDVVVDENTMPTGTTMAFKRAPRRPANPNQLSRFINGGKWSGYTPPPLPKEGGGK